MPALCLAAVLAVVSIGPCRVYGGEAFGPAERPKKRAFYAAAGKADITPDLERERIYLAGYGAKGRRAGGVHDPLYARAVVVSDNERTAALVAIDGIGIFRDDVEAIRAGLGWQGNDRYLFVSATHDHSAPDMLGLWGPMPGINGTDARYRRRVREAIAGLVRTLSLRLEEADLVAARVELDPKGLCRDTRDPIVIDPELPALQFRSKKGPIGTIIRWSCHPEVMGPKNLAVSADYPGALCSKVEKETGGACVFFSGAVGGLLSPEKLRSGGLAAPKTSEAALTRLSPRSEDQFDEARRIGESVADAALKALKKGEKLPAGKVLFRSMLVRVPVENSRYLLFLRAMAFGHKMFDAEGSPLPRRRLWTLPLRHLLFFPLPERLRPWIESEVSLIKLGEASILGIPGELFPELAIGGYGGEYAFGRPLIRPSNPNPPKLAQAPKGPFLRQKLRSKYGLIVGPANDELGYIVPEYDFQAARTRFMLPKPQGTHYEETNSIGPRATAIILRAAQALISP